MGRWKTLIGIATTLTFCHASAWAEPIAFLVGEYPANRVHNDSYVILIEETNASLLSHARELAAWVQAGEPAATMPDGRIVVTQIAAGADGINRNFLVPGSDPWSWHAIGEPSFADNTVEILDGWPTFIEDDVPGWMANTQGYVGLWSYTVIRELGPVSQIPEPSAIVLSSLALLACAASHGRRRGRSWQVA